MEYVKIAITVLGSVGSGSVIVLALSSWLGRVWASRILEADRARYSREVADFKKTLDLELREFEIKTSTIQIELNKVILNLAPLLAELWNACYISIELGKIHQQYDRSFLKVLAEKFNKVSGDSHLAIMHAQLFLPRTLFGQVREFEKESYAVFQDGCELFGYDSILYADKGRPSTYSDAMADSLLGRAKQLEEKREQIFEEFRRMLGTGREHQVGQSVEE